MLFRSSGNTLSATGKGTAVVTATITNGATPSTNYTQDFTIEIIAPALTGTASISGAAKYNETLTASLTSHNNTGTLSYQWKRAGANISGATTNTYTLVKEDIGKAISVDITSSVQTGTKTINAGVIAKADQSALSLTGIPTQNKTYGDSAFTVGATGGTGTGTVSYTSSNTAVATISGNTVTIVGAGSFTITATKASDDCYSEKIGRAHV